MTDHKSKIPALEALLYVSGEPLPMKKIAKILEIDAAQVQEMLSSYRAFLEAGDRGLMIIEQDEAVQLVTKPEFGGMLQAFLKEELSGDLTPASVEALSLIAYFGPLSRSRLDYLRGVNSSFILRTLLLRGLVTRSGDPKKPSAFLYAPSFALLRHLGVSKTEELPDYEKFRNLLRSFEEQSVG